MKTFILKLLLFSVLIFNLSCAQNYDWEKLSDGLYVSKTNLSKGNFLAKNDTLNIELYMFNPNDEINFSKPINGKPLKYKTTFSKLNKSFNYNKDLKFRKKSEYLIKQFNEKKIPNYSFQLNKISSEKMKEITSYLDKQYGISSFTESISNKNDKNETVISNLTLSANNEIDIEKVKKEFGNDIFKIQILNPNLLVYVYKIKT